MRQPNTCSHTPEHQINPSKLLILKDRQGHLRDALACGSRTARPCNERHLHTMHAVNAHTSMRAGRCIKRPDVNFNLMGCRFDATKCKLAWPCASAQVRSNLTETIDGALEDPLTTEVVLSSSSSQSSRAVSASLSMRISIAAFQNKARGCECIRASAVITLSLGVA